MAEYWSPLATEYNPILIGSIDGTDTIPHDRGIVRALNAHYRPNKGVIGDPACTVFVARLNHQTSESAVESTFAPYGTIRRIRLVRDVVTGFSKGYAFIEFYDEHTARRACREASGTVLDDKQLLVDMECERTLPGWVPRRLGGGFGGRKESGQLRFGGKDRPFRKPIFVAPPNSSLPYMPSYSQDVSSEVSESPSYGQRRQVRESSNNRRGSYNDSGRDFQASRPRDEHRYETNSRSRRSRSRSPHRVSQRCQVKFENDR